MVKVITDDWFKFTKINNFEFETINYGKGKVLIVKDFLKYPDKFYDLVTSFPFFDNMISGAAIGKGFSIPELHLQSYCKFLLDPVNKIFNPFNSYIVFATIHCMNGKMESYSNHPHVDVSFGFEYPVSHYIQYSSNLAVNLGLTKDMKGGTAMWSYKGKSNLLDMTEDELISYESEVNPYPLTKKSWEVFEESEDWKIDFISPYEYNSLVLYPTFQIHSPYLKSEWYNDIDRISISSFINIETKTLNPLDKF
jgi:hypothetical protein